MPHKAVWVDYSFPVPLTDILIWDCRDNFAEDDFIFGDDMPSL